MKKRLSMIVCLLILPPAIWLMCGPWLLHIELLSIVVTASPSPQPFLAFVLVLCRMLYLLIGLPIAAWLIMDSICLAVKKRALRSE